MRRAAGIEVGDGDEAEALEVREEGLRPQLQLVDAAERHIAGLALVYRRAVRAPRLRLQDQEALVAGGGWRKGVEFRVSVFSLGVR